MTETTKATHVDRVQAEFLAEVRKSGIRHTLEWITSWYQKVAEAAVQDDLERALGAHINDAEARELHLLDRLLPEASSNSNYSSQPGANLMRQALVEVRASLLNGRFDEFGGSAGTVGRAKRWEGVRARLVPVARNA